MTGTSVPVVRGRGRGYKQMGFASGHAQKLVASTGYVVCCRYCSQLPKNCFRFLVPHQNGQSVVLDLSGRDGFGVNVVVQSVVQSNTPKEPSLERERRCVELVEGLIQNPNNGHSCAYLENAKQTSNTMKSVGHLQVLVIEIRVGRWFAVDVLGRGIYWIDPQSNVVGGHTQIDQLISVQLTVVELSAVDYIGQLLSKLDIAIQNSLDHLQCLCRITANSDCYVFS